MNERPFVTQRPKTALRSLSKRGRASTYRERRRAVIGITTFATAIACTVWSARALADLWVASHVASVWVQTQSGTSLLTCACFTARYAAHIEPSVATQAHTSVLAPDRDCLA
jgi:hypothetical protein